jgi:hypothetical protein
MKHVPGTLAGSIRFRQLQQVSENAPPPIIFDDVAFSWDRNSVLPVLAV